MNRKQARNHLAEWLDEKMWRCFGTIDREAISIAVEALSADAVSRDVYDKRTQADEEIIDSYRQEFQKALSADAVDCTDFIEWLVDRVLDETIWENNSVAYGEIICRKLEKLGVLEVTEEPSYYIRPSAEAEWIPCSERLPSEGEEVLVYLWGDVPHLASVNSEGQWGTDDFYLDADDAPKAWMPLPMPYRVERSKP